MDKQIKEMKCFNCIHADVCVAQKGGVNLQLVNSMVCDYYQPKLPEGSVVLTEEEYKEILGKIKMLMQLRKIITRIAKEFGVETAICKNTQKHANFENHTGDPDWN